MLNVIKNHLKTFESWNTFCLLDSSFDSCYGTKSVLRFFNRNIFIKSINYSHVIVEEVYVNGNIEGIQLEYHTGDEIISLIPFIQGIKNGRFLSYFKDGSIRIEAYYLNDRKNGLFTQYSIDGNIKYSVMFENGRITF